VEHGPLAVTHQDGSRFQEAQAVLDLTMQAIQASLDGLAARQRVIATNVANAETPGYLARSVEFEDSLQDAIANGKPLDTTFDEVTSLAPTNTNSNNVSVDAESVNLVEVGLRYQLATESMNNKFRILRDSIRQGA
jgi:flagellar basal-body rod protein FlgB